ncbi:MAG: ATP-dependent DNA helicase DinG [Gammaproteobacteria bacterium]|jgi:ATP-dependent DNA helicase DinG|nr:ATP-dependent DNA helicase DinG [Gammaproteobacteria bacterium]MBT3859577.1 ATP-dependent DNA helicase DinG [Gammaproteobacteria bacterium]MBT3986529.1 ATP-dependent DNA helicase DinG [Gammaproteobacteria bacterium]MBT4254640.1 ATP-dependent DNA helicase DinG [Gammaproteobacteria bacterium]MBT4581127.1 ATP-dependent DNA helicase DinG [Gammaproteobacteria bacterium]
MLADEIKSSIQTAYSQMLESRELIPRYGQRLMIAEIAKTLAVLSSDEEQEPPICVCEAGTGTGKTLAYVLAVLPLAQALDLKVVIATATVALQEQVVNKDLPEILDGSNLSFSFSLAKGRGRYLCLSKLDMLLRGSDSMQAMMDLYGEELDDPAAGDQKLYKKMLEELSAGNWKGDRDDWKDPISDQNWKPVTVDNTQCMGPKCSHFRNCCFFQARDSLENADCIVSNQDLVLSDLALGGGVILPDPEKCIYIFDEAHHLPFKSNNHFSTFSRIKSSITWLERLEIISLRLQKDEFIDATQQKSLSLLCSSAREQLDHAWILLEQILESLEIQESYENRIQHAFKMGVVPEELQLLAADFANQFARISISLQSISDDLKDDMEDGGDVARRQLAEQWFPLIGTQCKRAAGAQELWLSFAANDPEGQAPSARWLSKTDNENYSDISLSSSPVLAAENLQERLWQSCAGAVLTSATLSALGQFDMLKMRAGLPEHTNYLSIASPFDYASSASLVVPRMNCEPSNGERHTELIVKAIPKLIDKNGAALMLFSSRRQMQDVLQRLPNEWYELILCQDDYQKSQLLKYHRQRIDKGEGSIIFGLSSFAEGVDLPGKYCTHVLIAKIPFAVPNDPIELTLSEWIEQKGMNPFMTLAVPDAAFKLVQASGRLLRNEKDTGKITLFDERIVSKRYGKAILDSMPPYKREIFLQEID